MKFYMNLENWIVPNSLPKACSTLVPKPDKDNLEKIIQMSTPHGLMYKKEKKTKQSFNKSSNIGKD